MCKTTTHQETAPYETQRDRETDVDDTVLLYNDECILLEKFYTNRLFTIAVHHSQCVINEIVIIYLK